MAIKTLKRLAYKEAPAELRKIIDDLQKNGDYLVVENEQRQPVAYLTSLPDADKARRAQGARKLRAFLDELPKVSPYSEEETFRHIEEAIAAIREQDRMQAVS